QHGRSGGLRPMEPDEWAVGPSDLGGRRRFLGWMAGGSLMPWLISPDHSIAAQESRNPADRGSRCPIPEANTRLGAVDWQLTRVRPDYQGFRTPWIEGYCSKQSVAAGETIEIMVSSRPPRPFRIELFRMGYYGGRGARLVS